MTVTADPGDLVRLDRTFMNALGIAADPTTVVLHVKSPVTGTITTPAVVNDAAVGAYHGDVTPIEPGVWRYKWVTTGDPQVIEQGSFTVRRLRVP